MLAISYMRFSSAKQAKGASLARQGELAAAYCKRRGWTLDEARTLTDKAVSAFRGKNADTGKLAAFLAAVQDGTIPPGTALIIESLDRLSRQQTRTALGLFSRILDAGITIVTLTPEREYTPHGTNELVDLLESLIVMSRANEESALKSQRAVDAWERRRREAATRRTPMTGRCPSWLRRRGDKFLLDEEVASLVRRIFRMAAEGVGPYLIARQLANEGVAPPRNYTHWTGQRIKTLLANRAVLGEMQPYRWVEARRVPEGNPVPGYFPAIVDAELFYQVQGLRLQAPGQGSRGNREGKVSSLFTGLLWDSADGSRIVNTGSNLASVAAMRGGDGRRLGFSLPYFEFAFLMFVKNLALPVRPAAADEQAAAEALLSDVQLRLAKLQALLEADPDESLVKAIRTARLSEQAAKERCERAAAATRDDSRDLSDLRQLAVQMDAVKDAGEQASVRERLKSRIRSLVSEIWVRVQSEGRFHRHVLAQVVLRAGGAKWFRVEIWSRRYQNPISVALLDQVDVGNLTLVREKRAS